jgi:hypothetical protein
MWFRTYVSTITNSSSLAKLLYACHYEKNIDYSFMYITYKVYQMGRSVAKSLSSLSLGPERKVKCYSGYFVNGYVFHTEEYGHGRKTYNNGVCVKGSTSSELEVDYYGRL